MYNRLKSQVIKLKQKFRKLRMGVAGEPILPFSDSGTPGGRGMAHPNTRFELPIGVRPGSNRIDRHHAKIKEP